MKLLITLLIAFALLFTVTGVLLAQESPLHPTFPLLDANGDNVLSSGEAVSSVQTCGSCHDAAYITEHTLHSDGGQVTAGNLSPAEASPSGVEMNCFLCHTAAPNNEARVAALSAGQGTWASTATLVDSGIVSQVDGAYAYDANAFDSEQTLLPEFVTVQDPTSLNCGACHGQVHVDNQTPLNLSVCQADQWETFTTGQVISPQRISSGGANISGRSDLARPWDVHAERVLNCTDCHHSANNPVYTLENPDTQPEHLTFDPRRIDLGEYLERPSHEFASGSTEMRTCESCHDAAASHEWLPYLERHTSALACESCHVPQMYAPALAYRDATVVQSDGAPVDACRGIENGIQAPPDDTVTTLLTSYPPTLLESSDADGTQSLSPYNLVTMWYWTYGDPPQPVSESDLHAAYLDENGYAPEVLAAFDTDGDGVLSPSELVLDTEAKTSLIAERLAARGLENPQIVGEVQPYAIHHTVVGGEWAIRDCQTCHSDDSRITAVLPLSDRTPGGVLPTLSDTTGVFWNGELQQGSTGTLTFQPETQTPSGSLYLFGRDSVALVDTLGILILLATSAGVTIHGGLRVLAGRRRAHHVTPEVRREYMYSIYERQWHWLQTVVIFGLIFTGLVIHRPATFSAFSFSWMVDLHNVFALILVINAALALFYHLASGEIKQFIPRPYGFFDQMVEQSLYYLRGIFRGDLHPFEKTRDHKLNPLQQMTYLVLLNVLLPAQVITGALIWGAQHVPALTNLFGGLPALAPLHTLIAWLLTSFIVLHVYLTTTGHTALAGIRSMVMGYDEVEVHPNEPKTETA